jgi:hypothetical protein
VEKHLSSYGQMGFKYGTTTVFDDKSSGRTTLQEIVGHGTVI